MFTIMKQTNSVITIFIQPDERDGESEHDEPRHAGDDEHEQWHAGMNNLFYEKINVLKTY